MRKKNRTLYIFVHFLEGLLISFQINHSFSSSKFKLRNRIFIYYSLYLFIIFIFIYYLYLLEKLLFYSKRAAYINIAREINKPADSFEFSKFQN